MDSDSGHMLSPSAPPPSEPEKNVASGRGSDDRLSKPMRTGHASLATADLVAAAQPPRITHSVRDLPGPEPERLALRSALDLLPASSVGRIRQTLDLIVRHTHASSGDDQRYAHLAALSELRRILRPAVTDLENFLAAGAFAHGATMEDLANATGMTSQGATDRWADLAGSRYIVVISRRDRTYEAREGGAHERIGEIGGPAQYHADRGMWRIGVNVRKAARYAVIAVDGTVRRVYEIDPDGWQPNPDNPREWQFRAVDDRAVSPENVDELHAAGELPYRIGSPCPTKAGGAYRPERFGPPQPSAEQFTQLTDPITGSALLPPNEPTTGEATMSTDTEQSERRAIACQLHRATSEASAVTTALDVWCGDGDYSTASEQMREEAGLRALAGLEATVESLTAVLEDLASAVATTSSHQ